MYSPRVRQLIAELPNRGRLEQSTHHGEAENPLCGDRVEFDLRVESGEVLECRFRAEGCPGAVASAAATALLVEGLSLSQVAELTPEAILKDIGGLPPHRRHGAQLAIQALQKSLTKIV